MYGKATNLKAWITTVPNKMNKAEKMRDKSGIISRLHVIEGVLVQQQTSVFCIICPFKGWRIKNVYLPVVMQDIVNYFSQVIIRCIDPSDYKHL